MVGSTIAYTLMMKDYVNEIVIIDIVKEKVEGDALDMMHGVPFVSPKLIKAGDYNDVKDAHIIIITAGAAQKPGETRLDLLKRNMKIFDSILDQIKPNLDEDAVVLVVSNPVDVLSYYTYKKLGISHNRVIGSGTVLDSSRLRYLISEVADVDPRNVHAYVIGEHGDSEVSAFSVSNIAQIPLKEYLLKEKGSEGLKLLSSLHDKVKDAAYEIIKKKGATYYAIGLATAKIVSTILNNNRSVLTVSTLVENEFDGEIDGVYISLPCVVGRNGIITRLHLEYSYEEVLKLIISANKLKETYKELEIKD